MDVGALKRLHLIRRDRGTQGLAQLLTPWAKHTYIGCWLPDMPNFRKGHGGIQNHTFKMRPFTGAHNTRFVVDKPDLLQKISSNLSIHDYLQNTSTLPDTWWQRSYKADQPGGTHLPDCLSSLYDTVLDLILMGDPTVDAIVPGNVGHSQYLDNRVVLTRDQISTFFFMMSHYVADSFMPSHCDSRPLAAYSNRFHEQWEVHWDGMVTDYFKKDVLLATNDTNEQVIDHSTTLDDDLEMEFNLPISVYSNDDIWEMTIFWCRASFAISAELFPEANYPFNGNQTPRFGDMIRGRRDEFFELDRMILQSAVYAVASTWKKIWRKFS